MQRLLWTKAVLDKCATTLMPTPMHVYRDIAARYGVDVASREALNHFFNQTSHDSPLRFSSPLRMSCASERGK